MGLTKNALRADIAELLFMEDDELADDADLFEEGLDSVRLLGLVERWRAAGAEVAFVDLAATPTVNAWWRVISSRGL